MKTVDILSMDCREPGKKKQLNKFLLKVPEVKQEANENMGIHQEIIPIEILEKVIQRYRKHGYKVLDINMYFEPETGRNAKFIYYHVSVGYREDWIGEIYGITLWETIGKAIIKIYAHEMSRKAGVKQN